MKISTEKKKKNLTVMESVGPGIKANDQNKIKQFHGGMRMGLDSETLLVIKLPDPKLLRVISRSVFLALVFITFPCIGSFTRGSNGIESNTKYGVVFNHEQLDLLIHDLSEEGLIRKSDKALIVSPGVKSVIHSVKNFGAKQIVMAMDSSLESQAQSSLVFDESFDFVFASNLATDVKFVDRVVKTGGIVAFPLSNDEQATILREKTDYRIVYLRRYSSTIVAVRKIKTRAVDETSVVSSFSKRHLLQSATEVNKAEALKELEEVLLEPPRRRQLSKDSKSYSMKIKFLPQLLGDDSLEGFRRRVFVNVGLPEQSKDVTQWFHQNYPKMKQEFEVYDLNVVPKEGTSRLASMQNDISDWLTKNVREEDYVVMKAEADAVEETINKRTIHLVDELFMECNNQWWEVGKNSKNESKRAYWECLALYGRVKDEGVAVHQWWG